MSRNFSLKELTQSNIAQQMGIDNTPSAEVVQNLNALADNILQPLRDAWGKPLPINSGYRCKALNAEVGGVSNSQHLFGQAADIRTSLPADLAELAINLELPFDQIGINNSFVHISYKKGGGNRGQVFYYKTYRGRRL